MSNLKKFQDGKLDIKENEAVFANEYTNISLGQENHL